MQLPWHVIAAIHSAAPRPSLHDKFHLLRLPFRPPSYPFLSSSLSLSLSLYLLRVCFSAFLFSSLSFRLVSFTATEKFKRATALPRVAVVMGSSVSRAYFGSWNVVFAINRIVCVVCIVWRVYTANTHVLIWNIQFTINLTLTKKIILRNNWQCTLFLLFLCCTIRVELVRSFLLWNEIRHRIWLELW